MPNGQPDVELEVLIQRRDRKSPAMLIDELKARVSELEQEAIKTSLILTFEKMSRP